MSNSSPDEFSLFSQTYSSRHTDLRSKLKNIFSTFVHCDTFQRNLALSIFLFLHSYIAYLFELSNELVVVVMTYLLIANSALFVLVRRGYIPEDFGSSINPFFFLFAIAYLVFHTGGLESPMLIYFWLCNNVAITTGYYAARSLAPYGLVLYTIYIGLALAQIYGNPFPQTPFKSNNAAELFHMCSVTLITIIRGTLFRAIAYEALEKERQSNLAKARFVANVSHEMRTPLTTIIGWTEVLLSSSMDKANKANVEVIKVCGEHLLQIINDIMEFAKIEDGNIEFECVTFDIRRLLAEVAASTEILISEPVKLVTELRFPQLRWVTGDPHRISQIINNFMSNAAKFTRSGHITFFAAEGQRKEVNGKRMVEIHFRVTDTGIGMSEATMNSLFLPFSQAELSTTRNYGGTGLGLSITRQLIADMGGSIEVMSQLGSGSTFKWNIWLEEADGPPSSHRRRKKITDLQSSGSQENELRVLLVDDNVFNTKCIKKLVSLLAYSVDAVRNGMEALEALKHGNYDVVLMDVQMPILNGIEATKRLRAEGNLIPIIGLTADVEASTRKRAIEAGMNGVLIKPVTLTTLKQALDKVEEERWSLEERKKVISPSLESFRFNSP